MTILELGCFSSSKFEKEIAGRYTSIKGEVSQNLIISTNKEFSITKDYGLIQEQSKGSWNKSNNKIILNSNLKKSIPKITIEDYRSKSQDSLYIEMYRLDSLDGGNGPILILHKLDGDREFFPYEGTGINLILNRNQYKYMEVNYVSQSIDTLINLNKKNSFTVKFVPESYYYLDNVKLMISGDSLIWEGTDFIFVKQS